MITHYSQAVENVKTFNAGIGDYRLTKKLSQFRHWYFIPELGQFGPSKYIGYIDNSPAKYELTYRNHDGRDTEHLLKEWFTVACDEERIELMAKLRELLAPYKKKPNKLARIHMLK